MFVSLLRQFTRNKKRKVTLIINLKTKKIKNETDSDSARETKVMSPSSRNISQHETGFDHFLLTSGTHIRITLEFSILLPTATTDISPAFP